MSHISSIKLKILDEQCLHTAMIKSGLERREKKTHKWYGVFVGDYPLEAGMNVKDMGKCDFAYGIPGNAKAYEVGVVRQPDGSLKLMWDFWNGGFGLQEKIGREGCKLISEYEAQVYYKQMASQGYEVSEVTLPDGTRQLTAVQYT